MLVDRDYYETLGVEPSATAEEIKRCYRILARRYHPDVNPSPDAVQMIKRVNAAYDTLGDADRRAVYDADRALRERVASGSARRDQSRTSPPSQAASRAGDSGSRVEFNGFGRTAAEPPREAQPPPKARATPTPPPRNVEPLLAEARLAFINRQFREAEVLCRQVVAIDSKSAVAYEILGDIYSKRGVKERAITCYSYAVQHNPRNFAVQTKLERLMGRKEARSEPIRPRAVHASPTEALLHGPHRDSFIAGVVLTNLVVFGGALLWLWESPGGALLTGGGWASAVSVNLLLALVSVGLTSGALLGFLGGMRPFMEEFYTQDLYPNGRRVMKRAHRVLLWLSWLWFYASLGVYFGVSVRRNRLSMSLLRAYALTILLTLVFVLHYNLKGVVGMEVPLGLVAGNLLFPMILQGWRWADRIRLSGH